MGEALKVLAQIDPNIATLTDAYTVPVGTSVVLSSIIVCNRDVGATSFRISIAVAGAADDPKQYLYYDIVISGNNSFSAILGITLSAEDVVRVYATLATLSFNLFGAEIT